MSKYEELKKQQPDNEECFWAFSKSQFKKGIEKKHLKDKKLLNGGVGLYGTQYGLDKMQAFYNNLEEQIRNQCTPQEIYNYEFWNHECEYSGSDEQALEIVISYFGNNLKNLVRR